MSELPPWVTALPGFTVEGWWKPIVCTGRQTHHVEFLGVVYENADRGGALHWSGGTVLSEDDFGISFTRLRISDETTDAEADEVRRLHGQGSMYIHCPHGCTPRIPVANWDEILTETRRVEPPWTDVSLYG